VRQRSYRAALDETHCNVEVCSVQTSKADQVVELVHRRLGHLGTNNLIRLSQEKMVKNLGVSWQVLKRYSTNCETCLAGRQIRKPFSQSTSTTNRPLELVHMDTAGPITPPTPEGYSYYVGMVDDHTRFGEVVLLRHKSEVRGAVKSVLVRWENQLGVSVQRVRSDRGTEFVNLELQAFFEEKGIVHETAAPYTPEQNGVAERFNRTLKDKATCMLFDAQLGEEWWGEAMLTACFLRNVSPVANKSQTPYEGFTGRVPDLQNLRVFGCRAYVRQEKKFREYTFSPKAVPGIFLGYALNTKAWKFLVDGRIETSRDAQFCETKFGLPEIGTEVDEASVSEAMPDDEWVERFVEVEREEPPEQSTSLSQPAEQEPSTPEETAASSSVENNWKYYKQLALTLGKHRLRRLQLCRRAMREETLRVKVEREA